MPNYVTVETNGTKSLQKNLKTLSLGTHLAMIENGIGVYTQTLEYCWREIRKQYN